MATASKIKFVDFLKAHSRAAGALAGVAVLPPAISLFVSDGWAAYVFPPIGEIASTAKIGLIAFSLAAIFGAYLLVGYRYLRTMIFCSIALSFALFIGYLSFASRFLRRIDIPAKDTFSLVSVGYERTDFALKTFTNESDWEMLRARGLAEEEIERLWTMKSIQIARTLLVASFFGTILCWAFAFSCVVSRDLSNTP